MSLMRLIIMMHIDPSKLTDEEWEFVRKGEKQKTWHLIKRTFA